MAQRSAAQARRQFPSGLQDFSKELGPGRRRQRGLSSTNRRFLIAYALLVALPVLVLLGILRHGRHISAPFSVDGSWKLQLDPNQLPASPCSIAISEDPKLTISQSGNRFTAVISGAGKSSGEGQLEGTSLNASLHSTSGTGHLTCGDSFSLVAKVDPTAQPRSLAGLLSVNGCGSCVPLAFHAVQEIPGGRKGLH